MLSSKDQFARLRTVFGNRKAFKKILVNNILLLGRKTLNMQ